MINNNSTTTKNTNNNIDNNDTQSSTTMNFDSDIILEEEEELDESVNKKQHQKSIDPTQDLNTSIAATNGTMTTDAIDLDSDSEMNKKQQNILETPTEIIDMTAEEEDEEEEEEEEEEIDEEEEEIDEEEEEESSDDELEDVIAVNDHKQHQPHSSKRYPLATEFEALANKLMKPIPDYPIKEQTHYVWEIEDWAKALKEEKLRSPTFKCGGFEWNILLFPRGNNQNGMLSIYMEPHPPDELKVDDDWYVCAQFGLDLWNPLYPDAHYPTNSFRRFSKAETDWGFSSLLDVKQLQSSVLNNRNNQIRFSNTNQQSSPHAILENNKLNITAFVKVIDDSQTGVLWHQLVDYDSKKNSGYVGLNNQGATCYLNSLLQSYFTTKLFRQLVYQIPTEELNKKSSTSVPLSLQRIFYLLTNSNDPVGTLELTKAFGWDSSDAFTQHDVQELNRILMDKLETAMKGTKIENKLNDIFVGKMKSYIKCVNVPYESSRVEDFWDIQLNVKGFKNLEESFNNYIEIEMLDGENKYQAGEDYGYQDAKKGVVFESFPPVLHLQLKRFEYDFMVDDLVKIDDFYEFPDKIDLKPYLNDDLPDEVKNQNWNYKLHGVLVHQGTISNGHYYAMIKPAAQNDTWLRFDDDKVWKVTPQEVFKDNFGAINLTQDQLNQMTRNEQQDHFMRRVTSAYMLVYYRETELKRILPDNDEVLNSYIPKHIPLQIQQEIEERERIEKARQEALYYTYAKIITISNFNNHSEFDYALDSTSDKLYVEDLKGSNVDPTMIKIKKDANFMELKSKVAEELGYQDNLNGFRLVPVVHRSNSSNRLDYPLSEEKLSKLTIQNVYSKLFNRRYDELVFFVEELNKDMKNLNDTVKSKDQGNEIILPQDFKFEKVIDKVNSVGADPVIVSSEQEETPFFESINEYSQVMTIFIKYFDPISQQIRGLSHITISRNATVGSLKDTLIDFLQFPTDTRFDFFEEVSIRIIELIDQSKTFDKAEINQGDIIVVQVKDPSLYQDKKFRSIKDYYRFLVTRIHIRVKSCKLELDEEDSDVVEREKEDGEGEILETSEFKEIEAAKSISKSFDLWISSLYSYQTFAKAIAEKLKCDWEYLRLFILTGQGHRYPLKTTSNLSQLFPKQVSVSQVIDFEYEILNIKFKDYENLKSIKIHWLNHTLLQYQIYELLVPRLGTVGDIIKKLLNKLADSSTAPKKQQLKHLLLWAGYNHTFNEILRFDAPISGFLDDTEIYCGIFPAEVHTLSEHDIMKRYEIDEPKSNDGEDPSLVDLPDFIKLEYKMAKENSKNLNLIPGFHFYKNSNYHHGVPFLFLVFQNELIKETKERLRLKLGLGKQAFEKVRLAIADSNDKGVYLDDSNDSLNLYTEIGARRMNLALDHPDRSPKRQNQIDKGISIR
ncbi:unnamed protein product [Candida verbasci]|uniref:ubiquitinyl hydrolase 1 n=1 Tax=Candida verbasci TaxID=1227364 RepID=A0A9W4XHG5_9ASCO|nr:unnamed protein product [Candida verbasci]